MQTSGRSYGVPKATVFKKTPVYKRAVAQAKTSNRQQLASRYTHTGPAQQTIAPKAGHAGLLATIVSPIGVGKALAHGDILGAVEAANPAAPILKVLHPTRTLLEHGAQDAINTPANVIPSTYHLATTAVSNPKKAAKELAQPYVHLAQHPVSDLVAHPLNSYLLFEGVKGGIGRTAGRVGRLAPKGTAVERAASTERAPATLPGTTLKQVRRYSPDVTVKARQVAQDKLATRKSARLTVKAQRAQASGDEFKAIRLSEKAARKDPTLMQPGEIRRRMDESVDANEVIRRQNRAQVTQQVRHAVPKDSSAAVSLVAQGITKASKGDLVKYRDELAQEHGALSGSRARANRVLRQQITKAVNGKMDEAAIQAAADRYGAIVRPLQEKIANAGLYDRAQMERRSLLPYAVRNMGAKATDEGFVAQDGSALSNDQIRAHMEAHGVNEPAYITQAPSSRGARNFYVAQHEPPPVSRAKYTGKATRQGTFDAHPDTLAEGAARMQGLVDAQEGFRRLVSEFGRRENGKLHTLPDKKTADNVIRNLNAKAGPKWRAIRMNPFAGGSEQLNTLVDQVHAHDNKHLNDSITAAVEGHDGPGPWAIVPEAAADQLRQHVRVLGSGGGGKAFQIATGAFRKSVLATSPRWLFGNTGEAGLRAAVAKAGPRSYVTMKKITRNLAEEPPRTTKASRAAGAVGDAMFGRYKGNDPAAAQELSARAIGGGHYTMAERQPRRGAEQFRGTKLEPLANALGTFWRAPGPKQVAGVWHGWTQFVFHDVNSRLETQFQTAMAGAHVRRNLMTGHMLKLSDKAVQEAAQGLRETNAQVELGRAVDRMYGQYNKFSPEKRRTIALYTPFVAWSLNAFKFLTQVLPADHPVLTSLGASASQASEEWRKQHGLDKFMKAGLPSFLQGTIPLSGDRKLPASRYTPFGLADDLPGTLAGSLLPQLSGVQAALRGTDWKGKKLTVNGQPPNDLQIGVAAAQAFAESTIPLVGQAQQYAGGKTLPQMANPFTPYTSKAKKKTGGDSSGFGGSSSGSSGWSGGGSSSKSSTGWGG